MRARSHYLLNTYLSARPGGRVGNLCDDLRYTNRKRMGINFANTRDKVITDEVSLE